MSGVNVNAATDGGRMQRSRFGMKDAVGEGKQIVTVNHQNPNPDKEDAAVNTVVATLIENQISRMADSIDNVDDRLRKVEGEVSRLSSQMSEISRQQVNVAEIRDLLRLVVSILVRSIAVISFFVVAAAIWCLVWWL